VGAATGPASAATSSFTGIGIAPSTSAAGQLAVADAQQRAVNAGFAVAQCAVTDEGYDYLPSRGSWRAEVTLTCDSSPVPTVTVPSLVGEYIFTAESQITAAGLAVGIESWDSWGLPWGTVVGQAPAAGATVAPGTAVFLYVANGQG
jgi:serine/threonine-protein kinase